MCTWNVPTGKIDIKAKPVEELVFQKSTYTSQSTKSKAEYKNDKEAFKQYNTTLYESHQREISDIEKTRKSLFELLKHDIMESSLYQNIEEIPSTKNYSENHLVPYSLLKMAKSSYTSCLSEKENIENFILKSKLSDEQINAIKISTINQSSSKNWVEQRKGRITASIFHRVYTRVKSLKKDPQKSGEKLIHEILKLKPVPSTYSMKHGLAMEPHAKRKFVSLMTRKHNKFKYFDSGLHVMKEYPHIGASPDLIVECDCCGPSLVEIKCPFTSKDEKPSVKLEYLEEFETELKLKTNSSYYFQIQGQMGVTKIGKCYFFVFSHHGFHLEMIYFDQEFWQDMILNLDWFWVNHVAPALLFRQNDAPQIDLTPDNPVHIPITKLIKKDKLKPKCSAKNKGKTIKKKKACKSITQSINPAKKIQFKSTASQYVCGICFEEIANIPMKPSENIYIYQLMSSESLAITI